MKIKSCEIIEISCKQGWEKSGKPQIILNDEKSETIKAKYKEKSCEILKILCKQGWV